MNPALLDPKTWCKAAFAHALDLLERAGVEYARHAADKAERESGGVLAGLLNRLDREIDERAVKEVK